MGVPSGVKEDCGIYYPISRMARCTDNSDANANVRYMRHCYGVLSGIVRITT